MKIVQYGDWQAWDKDGDYSSRLANELEQEIGEALSAMVPTPPTEGTSDSRLMQAIKETMGDLGINSGGSTDE